MDLCCRQEGTYLRLEQKFKNLSHTLFFFLFYIQNICESLHSLLVLTMSSSVREVWFDGCPL